MMRSIALSTPLLATTFLVSLSFYSQPAHAQAPIVGASQPVVASGTEGLDSAAQALRERRWLTAIDSYKQLVNSNDAVVRGQARYGLALALSQMGEDAEAYKVLDGTLRDETPLGRAVGDLRGRLALQLAERFLAEKGTASSNPWLSHYERLTDQPDRARYERLRAAYDNYQGDQASSVFRVGVILPLNGPLSEVGTSILQGLQLGLQEFDGRRGTRMELVVQDSGDTATAAHTLRDQNVDVVVGPLLAPNVSSAAEAFTGTQTPILALSNDKTVMGNGVYALNYLPSEQARLAARAAVRQGHRKLAVLAPSTDYGTESLEAFTDEARREGATVTGTAYFDPNATDIGASIRQLTGASPTSSTLPFDALLVPAPAAKMPLIKAQLSYYGVNNATVMLLGTGLWQNNDLLRSTSGMRGAVFAAAPKVQGFEQKFKATFGEDAAPLAATGYDTARILADIAAEKQRTGKPVTDLLTRPEGYYGSGGYFRFNANGLTERGLDVVSIGTQFEVKKPALNLPPLPLPADVRPDGAAGWRWQR